MTGHLLAGLFVLVVWWASTGVILLLVGLPRWTFRYSLTGVTGLALAGLAGLAWSSRLESRAAAFVAFGCALAIWAWHELTFLLGVITGPRRESCPPTARGWRRFRYGTAALIHHELALALTVVLVVTLTWRAPNQVGTGTFLVLWVMRLSAKFNVFLGVRNVNVQFIPHHLRYLVSYFRRAALNPLMPVSLLGASVVVVRLAADALADGAPPFVVVGRTLVATLLAVAVLEHLFLALPIPDAVLWRWAIRPGHGERPALGSGAREQLPVSEPDPVSERPRLGPIHLQGERAAVRGQP